MRTEFNIDNIEIKKFNPMDCPEKEWVLYHEYRKIRHQETNPEDPFTPNEISEKNLKMLMQHPEMEIFLFTFMDSLTEKKIGEMLYGIFRETSPSYEGNKHLMQFDMSLLPEYRRKGIGKKALKMVYDFATEKEKSVLIASSDEADGKGFLKAIGAQTALSGVENRLNLEDVDWEMVENWANEGPSRSPETELKLVYSIPDDIIEQYAKVYTETLNQQPLGDLDIKAIIFTPESLREMEKRRDALGRKHLTYMTIEPNGDISGLTELLFRPERENMIEQLLTGVKQEYRGRGLGKWLKAIMLKNIKEDFPQVKIVRTDNATTNAPMLSINERLGFKIHKEAITGQIQIDGLGKYLEGK